MSKSLTNKVVKFLALFSGSGVLLLSLTFPLVGIGAFTEQINYQGKLTNTAGSAVTDGNYSIAFTLYNASSGGSSVWTETQTVAVANGLFSVMLGSVASLSSVDFNQALYLTINVNGDGEMSPRKLISAVPNALNSNKFGGLATTSFLRSDITNATATITNLNSQYLSVNGSLSVFGTTTNYLGGGSYISLDSFSILGLGDIPIITSRADSDAILGSDLNILGVADRLWIKETDGLSDIGLSFYDNSLTSVAGFSVATSTKYFTFSDANSWTFRSTGPGNDPLTINTANSSVSIGTTTNFSNSFYVNATSTFEGLSTFTGESTFTNNVTFPHMFINSANGGIGIGTTTPDSFSLSVNSTSTFYQDTTFYGDIVSRPYSNNIKIIGGENVLLPSSARNVFVYGHYAYVVSYPAPSGSHGLRIIDISDPKNPKNTGELELELPEAIASRVRVVGNYAYVSFFADLISGTPNAGFRIIDVTDKYNPKVVSGVGVSTSVGSEHSCMEVSGKYMYLCSDNGGIEVIDISDPYGPFVAGAITGLPIKPWDIKINKNRLYYATKNDLTGSALRVLDISNPTNPVVLGGSNLDSDFDSTMIWSMDYANDYLYIAMGYDFGEPAGANHFRIIDVSSSTNPVIVGGENLVFGDGTANYVKVAGNRAYVSQWNTQFSVIDVSSSTNPYFITETISNTYGGNTIISFDFYGKYIVAGYSYVPWPGPNYNNFRILEIGGMDVGTANIGVLETDNLGVGKNALFRGLLSVLGSLRSYGGLISDGSLAVLSTTSPSYFAGNLGIGTTTPSEKLVIDNGSINAFNSLTGDYFDGIFTTTYNYQNTFKSNALIQDLNSNLMNVGVYGFATSTDPGNYALSSGVFGAGQYGVLGQGSFLGGAFYGQDYGLYSSSNNGFGGFFDGGSVGIFVSSSNLGAGISANYLGANISSSYADALRVEGQLTVQNAFCDNSSFDNQIDCENDGSTWRAVGSPAYSLYSTGGLNYFEQNVGIGTTTPQHKLTVDGDFYFEGENNTSLALSSLVISSANPVFNGLTIPYLNSTMYLPSFNATGSALAINNNLNIIDSTEGFSFGPSSLGINIFSRDFTKQLGIDLDTATGTARFSNNNNIFSFGDISARQPNIFSDNIFSINLSTSTPNYYLSQSNTMAIMGGRVGIGTTTPAFPLVVYGASTTPLAEFSDDFGNSLKFNNSSLGPSIEGHTDILGSSMSAVVVKDTFAIINSSANGVYEALGTPNTIGLSFSDATLATSSDITFEDQLGHLKLRSNTIELNTEDGVTVTDLAINGAVYSNNGVLTNTNPSSRTYKNNILDTSLNIDGLLGLQVKSFNWNNSGQSDFGLIAEEIQAVLPELYVDDGVTKGYRADHLPFYLLQIAQRQAKQITELDNRIASGTINFSSTTDTLSLIALQSLTGTWSISAGGILTVKKVVAEQLMVEDGVTVKDKATGGYTCIYVENGTIKTSAGECGSGIISEPTPTPPPSEEPATPEPSPEEPAVEPTPEEPTPDIPPEPTPEPPPAEEPTPPAEPPAPPVEAPASPVG